MSEGCCVGCGVLSVLSWYWPLPFFVNTGFETSWQVPQNSLLEWNGLLMSHTDSPQSDCPWKFTGTSSNGPRRTSRGSTT